MFVYIHIYIYRYSSRTRHIFFYPSWQWLVLFLNTEDSSKASSEYTKGITTHQIHCSIPITLYYTDYTVTHRIHCKTPNHLRHWIHCNARNTMHHANYTATHRIHCKTPNYLSPNTLQSMEYNATNQIHCNAENTLQNTESFDTPNTLQRTKYEATHRVHYNTPNAMQHIKYNAKRWIQCKAASNFDCNTHAADTLLALCCCTAVTTAATAETWLRRCCNYSCNHRRNYRYTPNIFHFRFLQCIDLSMTESWLQYECVVSRVNASCHIWKRHVTHEWVMSCMKESCHIRVRCFP